MRIGLFDFMYAFQCILNTLLESIKPFNTVQCNLCTPIYCSVREYQFDFSPLCWHNIPAYYVSNYPGIFDEGLSIYSALILTT